ncbi:MAG: oligoribonuclease [Planctomycetota bacterium]|jgi:oligoribonuclease
MSQAQPKPDAPLVWIDMEMSGLDPDRERILEFAVLLTDDELAITAEGPELVIHQSDVVLGAMDEWNTSHHGGSGLTERVRLSTLNEGEAEEQILAFLRQHCEAGTGRLAGNSVWQDRRFLERYMPKLVEFLHYRLVDVSTLKELAARWSPDVVAGAPRKGAAHRAMADIRESIEELRYYREAFIR